MNSFFIPLACIGGLIFSTNLNAQTPGRHVRQDQSNSVEKKTADMTDPTPVVTRSKTLNDVEISRKTLNKEDLSRLPVRDINSIANTVSGVHSYGGGTPSIKGAPTSGTAYFVDGVRVHGAMTNSVK